jgi:hypothetical protein
LAYYAKTIFGEVAKLVPVIVKVVPVSEKEVIYAVGAT